MGLATVYQWTMGLPTVYQWTMGLATVYQWTMGLPRPHFSYSNGYKGGPGVFAAPPLSRTLSSVVEQHLSNLKVC